MNDLSENTLPHASMSYVGRLFPLVSSPATPSPKVRLEPAGAAWGERPRVAARDRAERDGLATVFSSLWALSGAPSPNNPFSALNLRRSKVVRGRLSRIYDGEARAIADAEGWSQATRTDYADALPLWSATALSEKGDEDGAEEARARRRYFQALGRARRVERCGELSVATDEAGSVVFAVDQEDPSNKWKPPLPVVNRTRCELEWCPSCSRRRAARRCRRLEQRLGMDYESQRQLSLVTMSSRNIPGQNLKAELTRIEEALAELRRDQKRRRRRYSWWNHIDGAILRIEVTRSSDRIRSRRARKWEKKAAEAKAESDPRAYWIAQDQAKAARGTWVDGTYQEHDAATTWWHVHVHCVVRTHEVTAAKSRGEVAYAWVPQNELADDWRRILATTGGAYGIDDGHVDVRQHAKGTAAARHGGLAEVAKYVAKASLLYDLDESELGELVREFTGRRLLRTWGAWYGDQGLADVLKDEPVDGEEALDDDEAIDNPPPPEVGRPLGLCFDEQEPSGYRYVEKNAVCWREDTSTRSRAETFLFLWWEHRQRIKPFLRARRERGRTC